jgi:hypothetical protein
VFLYADGKIIFQYAGMRPPLNEATVGIQNHDRTTGLEICFNDYYIHSNMAIKIYHGLDGIPPVHYNLYRSETSPVPLDPVHLITDDIPGDTMNYIDRDGLINGTTYYYVLTAVWHDSVESPGSNEVSAIPGGDRYSHNLTRAQNDEPSIPEDFILNQNYPNPFNSSTEIKYALPFACHISLDIYNISGEKVVTLYNGIKQAGYHSIIWNGKSSTGNETASGLYLYKLTTPKKALIEKMLLLK